MNLKEHVILCIIIHPNLLITKESHCILIGISNRVINCTQPTFSHSVFDLFPLISRKGFSVSFREEKNKTEGSPMYLRDGTGIHTTITLRKGHLFPLLQVASGFLCTKTKSSPLFLFN